MKRYLFSFLLTSALVAVALSQNPPVRIVDIHRDGPGDRVAFQTDSDGHYYVLRRGDTLAAIGNPVDLKVAPRGTNILQAVESSATTGFYKVERVPVSAPVDSDGDGAHDLLELDFQPYRSPLTAADASVIPPVFLDAFPEQTTNTSETVTGRAWPGTTVTIAGGSSVVSGQVSQVGTYAFNIPLRQNRMNRLFLSASGSAPVAVNITHDREPPTLYVDFPSTGSDTIETTTTLAGRVGDVLSGALGLNVTINGQPAAVAIGLGQNGTFDKPSLPLALGSNTFTIVATDALGNQTTRTHTVVRKAPGAYRMERVSGDAQFAAVHSLVPQPVTVRVIDGNGQPFADKLVDFQVTRSDGKLLPGPSFALPSTRTYQVRTDENGLARAWWILGGTAGCAADRVEATSAGVDGTAPFCATARPGPASQINIGSGNNQIAEVGAPAPAPLKAWVNDSCNGIVNLPVTFTVTEGNGTVNGQTTVTVNTGPTGHAEVDFRLATDGTRNAVEATFAGNPGLPAVFTATGRNRNPLQPTVFRGLVLDNANQPLGGAHVWAYVNGQAFDTVFTDAQGFFELPDLPAGAGSLFVDGAFATLLNGQTIPQGSFPSLSYEVVVTANTVNELPTPVRLPRLDPANSVVFNNSQDVVLRCAGIEGLELRVKAGSMRKADGSLVSPGNLAILSLNQVHHDEVPMPMPDGASPPFAWTLQPGGATFNPPIEVTYPNMSGLAPGATAYFLTYNHALEQFQIVSSGQVSEDGSVIRSDAGSGLNLAGWGCNCPPYSVTGICSNEVAECSDLGVAARKVALTVVASAFAFLQPVTGPAYAGEHLLHFLFGDGSDRFYVDGSAPVEQIKSHPRFLAIHDNLVGALTQQAVDARAAGQTSLPGFSEDIGGISLYEPGQGAFPTTQLAAGVGALSEGFQASAGQFTINGNRLQGTMNYSMRDHYRFSPDDCEFGGPDGMACKLQECRTAHPFFTHFDFQVPVDIQLPEPSELLVRAATSIPAPSGAEASPVSAPLVNTTIGRGLNDSYTLTVNGQTAVPRNDGSFILPNVSAADNFGPGGPGTRPDFLSDDALRLIGVSRENGQARYAFTQPFFIGIGQVIRLADLDFTFTDSPPPTPSSIRVVPDLTLLTAIGQTTQARVTATLMDGSTSNVTARTQWTTYRTSNPAVATIDADGLVTAHARGGIFVTAINEGATSVTRIEVRPGVGITSVEGYVRTADGQPAVGALLYLSAVPGDITSQTGGKFVFPAVPLDATSLVVNATYVSGGSNLVGSATITGVLRPGTNDAGVIVVAAPSAPEGMALIPAGEFLMGDAFGEGVWDEIPVHPVYVSAFFMDKYEVSKQLWDDVYTWAVTHGYTFSNSGSGKAANHPVHTVNWYDCVKWCNARSEKAGLSPAYYTDTVRTVLYRTGEINLAEANVNWTGGGFRLPTEAEWEKAARGGLAGQRFPWGANITHAEANYYSHGEFESTYDTSATWGFHPLSTGTYPYPYTIPVGSLPANGYGLFDMAGNLWEWNWDWYDDYTNSPGTDPHGSTTTSSSCRVVRGGAESYDAFFARCACRYCDGPASFNYSLGFRCVR